MSVVRTSAFILALLLGLAGRAQAQANLPVPEASPAASVTQTIGITEVTVTYHRPGAKGRVIWGGIVANDQVWRAGANENTTIRFSGPVQFAGTTVAEGTYGLHMIPTDGEFTVILSKNATSWGSYFYSKAEDALRVQIKPRQSAFQEWLSYRFEALTENSATLSLSWGEREVPMLIEVDVPSSVVQHAREVYLRGPAGFGWQGHYQAANYCAMKGVNLEEATTWADQSIQANRNFSNLWVKGLLQEKMGKSAEGKKTKEEALSLADEAAVNALGYQYLQGGSVEEALSLFTTNVQQHPGSWNAYDSLGEGYAVAGKTSLAIENYSKALSMVSDEAQKTRIGQVLKALKAK